MAIRMGTASAKRTRLAARRCPECRGVGTLDELKNGHQALQSVIQQQRLKALAKARKAKARKAASRRREG